MVAALSAQPNKTAREVLKQSLNDQNPDKAAAGGDRHSFHWPDSRRRSFSATDSQGHGFQGAADVRGGQGPPGSRGQKWRAAGAVQSGQCRLRRRFQGRFGHPTNARHSLARRGLRPPAGTYGNDKYWAVKAGVSKALGICGNAGSIARLEQGLFDSREAVKDISAASIVRISLRLEDDQAGGE